MKRWLNIRFTKKKNTIKGKAKEFYKAHGELRDLVIKNKQYTVGNCKIKVLDVVKHTSMDDCTGDEKKTKCKTENLQSKSG